VSTRPCISGICAFLACTVLLVACFDGLNLDGGECVVDADCGPNLQCNAIGDKMCCGDACAAATSTASTSTSTGSGPVTVSVSTSTARPSTSSETASATIDTSTTTSTSDSSTTEEPDCDPELGLVNDQCPSQEPYCADSGDCVDCTQIDCSALDEDKSVCSPASGTCVVCTEEDSSACKGSNPVCDTLAGECTICTEHAQCASGACNKFDGTCFPQNALWVDKLAPCNGATGSKEKPYCEIQDAAATIGKNDPTLIWVEPSAPYEKTVSIESSRVVAIRSTSDTNSRLSVEGLPSLLVNQGSVTFLERLQIDYPSEDRGVVCSGGSLWADHVQIQGRHNLGVDAMANCQMVFRRSKIANNSGGGIQLSGGSLRLENSFVVSNGSDFSEIGGVTTNQGAELNLVYSSVISNQAQNELRLSMGCSPDTSGTVRNSIILGTTGGAASFECGGLEYEYNAIDNGKIGGTNTYVEGGLDPTWFVQPQTGDFHLKNGNTTFKDVALWINGDPDSDYDGAPRPSVDGTVDYAGADIPR